MLDETKCIYLNEYIRKDNFKHSSFEKAYEDHGVYLADLWLKEKAQTIDLWGFDWWSEEFVNAFLQRVMEVEGSIKEVDEIKWYFFCESFNYGPPCHFLNKVWIKNFLSNSKINAYGEKGEQKVLSDLEVLSQLANGGEGFYHVEFEKFLNILNEIETDNNQIKNAEYITDKIASLKE